MTTVERTAAGTDISGYVPLEPGLMTLSLHGKRVAGVRAVVSSNGCPTCGAPIGFLCRSLVDHEKPVCVARVDRWWGIQNALHEEVMPPLSPWKSLMGKGGGHKKHKKR
jgi:hypothetical protein